MRPAVSLAVRSILSVVALAALTVPPQASPKALPEEHASYRPEVRIRRLHLVRPDLIPYPLVHEVLC